MSGTCFVCSIKMGKPIIFIICIGTALVGNTQIDFCNSAVLVRTQPTASCENLPNDMRTLVVQSAADKTSSRNQAQRCAMMQRVVPLFETLDDLDNAGATLQRLLDTPWYRKQLRCTCCSLYSIEVARTCHPDEAFLQLGIPFLHSTQLVSLLGNLDALSYTKPNLSHPRLALVPEAA